jgi:predicted SnoaL-like aldol condensation-catalyzing enzyme
MRIASISLVALAVSTVFAVGVPGMALAETPAQMAANKKIVLEFWHSVFDAEDVSKAKNYLAPEYHQHNPNVATGLKGFEDFFGPLWPKPKAPADIKPTKFEAVLAEGDLVTVMFKRVRPEVGNPTKTYDSFWFDLFRVKNGKIVEHWDCALKPMQ